MVQLVAGIVQHRGIVMRITVEIMVVHRALKMVAVQAGHRGGCRVLMMLHREAARRSDHEVLQTQIRIASATAAASAATAAASGEFEAPPGPAAPLHTIEG